MDDAQLVSPAGAESERSERPKILVVEDDPDIRKLLELFLTEKRFQVKVTDGAQAALETLDQRLQGCVTFEGIVARSQRMLEVFAFVERLARYPTTALITGESGTGKELIARALHRLSPLRDRPFVICNCTTLAPTLLESELFGHLRGSFTGADRDRKGLFEAAHGGTIFLDEIGELPLGVQVKLLRVLENREIKRIGSPDPIRIDIRVIAATNRDLADMVRQGAVRDRPDYRPNAGALPPPPPATPAGGAQPPARPLLAP